MKRHVYIFFERHQRQSVFALKTEKQEVLCSKPRCARRSRRSEFGQPSPSAHIPRSVINHHDVFSCALAQFRMQTLMGTEAQIHTYF